MSLKRFIVVVMVAAIGALSTTPAAALAIANSILSFSNLAIVPATGALTLNGPWLLQAFASANNSLGESDAQFNATLSPQPVAATAAVTWAQASGSASAPNVPPDLEVAAAASSSVHIPGCGPAAGFSEGHGTLSNTFTISGSGDVSVHLEAQISGALAVMTDSCGLRAFTQTIFTLSIDGGDPLVTGLFDRRFLEIGSSSSLEHLFDLQLVRDVVLSAGVPHFLLLQVDSESLGQTIPEPSTGALLLVLCIWLAAIRWLGACRAARIDRD